MFIYNRESSPLVYRTNGAKIVLSPMTVTYVEDSITTPEKIKASFGSRISVVSEQAMDEMFIGAVQETSVQEVVEEDVKGEEGTSEGTETGEGTEEEGNEGTSEGTETGEGTDDNKGDGEGGNTPVKPEAPKPPVKSDNKKGSTKPAAKPQKGNKGAANARGKKKN